MASIALRINRLSSSQLTGPLIPFTSSVLSTHPSAHLNVHPFTSSCGTVDFYTSILSQIRCHFSFNLFLTSKIKLWYPVSFHPAYFLPGISFLTEDSTLHWHRVWKIQEGALQPEEGRGRGWAAPTQVASLPTLGGLHVGMQPRTLSVSGIEWSII